MEPTATLVWLFDIDGTLLRTAGAGREALELAFEEVLGIPSALEGVPMGGRTDPLIVGDALARHGVAFRDGQAGRFWGLAETHMARLLSPARGGLLPGVPELLDRLAAEPAWVRALLTGNMAPFARIKLDRFGIFDRFAFGTYGGDGPDRGAMARVAVARAAERHGVGASRCVVVGDTDLDIACAREAGARAVAVATGGCSREALAAHAPDLLLDDLTQADTLLAWARAIERGAA